MSFKFTTKHKDRIKRFEKTKRDEERARRALKDGQLPLCGQVYPGVWWVEGIEGKFFRDTSGTVQAFDAANCKIVTLTPADPLEAFDYIAAYLDQFAGQDFNWADDGYEPVAIATRMDGSDIGSEPF